MDQRKVRLYDDDDNGDTFFLALKVYMSNNDNKNLTLFYLINYS